MKNKPASPVQSQNIIRLVLIAMIILLVPLLAMQFTTEVNWGVADFIIAGTLLIGTGLIYEFGIKRIKNSQHRIIVAALLAVVLLLIWVELAVGIFGTPFGRQ